MKKLTKDYISNNKLAWEEAFENKKPEWKDDYYKLLNGTYFYMVEPSLTKEIVLRDFKDKHIGQFCCNNGRELLSIMQLGASSGVGFDIATNIIDQANYNSKKSGYNCEFIACNILEIESSHYNTFDYIFLTAGSLCWFENPSALFNVVYRCLKTDGVLIINEIHPFTNMLPFPGEEKYDASHLNRIQYKYFNNDPWIGNSGVSYMSKQYESKTFTSFTHTTSKIINSVIDSGLTLSKFDEHEVDVGGAKVYNEMGYPLSYTLVAKKM